ncbi:hypothetical protein EJ04DRAFT_136955 [Polyplosphaeria fusca]|uniref:Uncharacterized protein n=1 Tax=Polyplosphaeria fusca TaxID=682080 RepID=A0A9P4QMB4_9PLEO|nr:hypothetical protein EJ04DRAFT_136955 [Polyplosphaeria fusca]
MGSCYLSVHRWLLTCFYRYSSISLVLCSFYSIRDLGEVSKIKAFKYSRGHQRPEPLVLHVS